MLAVAFLYGAPAQLVIRKGSEIKNPLVTYNILVEWGHPAEKILEYAENHGYELIIMGRRPFRTWSRIGNSTSVEVAQRSSIPVMIVQVPSS